eukprot:scaffold342679_cov15-Prasinocladus_malaysianus.AAC.1
MSRSYDTKQAASTNAPYCAGRTYRIFAETPHGELPYSYKYEYEELLLEPVRVERPQARNLALAGVGHGGDSSHPLACSTVARVRSD